MKITNARVIVCSPGRNFVTLKIETDQGLTGIGDATLNGRELAVAAYLTEHVIPCLIGRDPQQSEDIWQYLYRGAYWRRGPVTMCAIAAIDTALWDIKAKLAGQPLYQLLAGASRSGVMVYGHANGRDIEETSDEVARYREMGYLAIRAQSGVPGLASTYGVSRDKMFYEPADADLPTENVWSTPQYLEHVPKLIEAERSEAEQFACNAVVIGRCVITNTGCDQLHTALAKRDYLPIATPLGEFVKAGGSAKCLTLRLDGEEAAAWRYLAKSDRKGG